MDDQTLSSVYSFTSYNTLHYSDITNRLHQKVNSYAIEINQKVKDDNQSLNDMEEGIIALSNYLNGVEEKRPSVSELIGSRINLDDCLKLKLEIREKIRKTKKIRTDLFTSSIESPHSGPKNKPDVKFDVRLTPQTSRNVSPRNYGQPESELQVHLKQPKLRPKPIETSKSFSSLPSSTPTSIRSAKAISAVEPIAPVRIDPPKNLSPSNEAIQEKRISQSNDILATPVIKPPLITPLIPTSSQKQRSLAPIDDLADRQLAWLLNIEAKNRQTRQALEAQSIRELKVAPDIAKAQESWLRVKKIHKKKYGTEIGSRKSDLESIDENESTFSTSVTSSLISVNTLLNRYSQTHNRAKGNKPKRKHQTAGELSQSQSIPILGLEPLPSIVTKGDSRAIISPSIIHPSDHTSSSEEILTFRVEEDDEEEKDTQSVVSRTRQMDCETPRVITWTDLSYDPNEYHQIEFTKSLQLESLSVDKNDNKEEYVVATSRSDQSDYEIEWDRANRKIH